MEKKNTILLTVIAVATLLVAVVGATFAYFTATTQTGTGAGTTATDTPTTVGGTNIELAPIANVEGAADMKYPGGKMVVGGKVTASATGDNTYNMTYTVNAEIDTTALGSSTSEVKWTLYEVADEVTGKLVDSCHLDEVVDGNNSNNKNYSYSGCTVNTGITSGTPVLGEAKEVGTGTISTHTAKTTITATDEALSGVKAGADQTTVYYLVVEYVNADTNQAGTDAGKAITASIISIADGKAAVTQ